MRRDAAALTLLLSVLMLAVPSQSAAGDEKAALTAVSPATITFSFKLDPRLAGPTYGGERWVSPRTYTGASAQDTVEAKALAVDGKGTPLRTNLEWTVSDNEVVTVSPPRGERVKITTKRAGESTVTVKSGPASGKLNVKAVQANGILYVSISQ